jgi:hypothetical protein
MYEIYALYSDLILILRFVKICLSIQKLIEGYKYPQKYSKLAILRHCTKHRLQSLYLEWR